MLRSMPLMTWGFVFTLCLPVFAQADALNELYGNGVHAYNGGDYLEAYNQLTRAIQNESRDPRVQYYRGLSYLKLGRPQEAEADFASAAQMEMADIDRFYNVSKALERIQGRARTLIEKHRSEARLAAYHERERARYERYERIRRNEPNVLLQPKSDEETEAKPEPAEKAEGGEEKAVDAPPAPEEEMPAEEKSEEEAKPEAESDPFADKDGDKEEMPAEEKPEEEAKPEAESDPFADKEGDKEEMPAEEKADDESKPEEEGAADEAKSDEEGAAEEKPAEDKADAKE